MSGVRALRACVLAFAVASAASAAGVAPARNLGKPGVIRVLDVELYRGIVRIRADRSTKSVKYEAGRLTWERFDRGAARPPGVEPLSETLLQTSVEGDTARFRAPTVRDLVVLDVVIPAGAAVRVRVVHYGEITIDGSMGGIETEVFQGRITLNDVPGPVLAHVARDGDIRARLTRSPSSRPMSFTTYEGDVDLEVPASAGPRLRTDAMQGEVHNDLPLRDETPSDDTRIRVRTARGVIHVRALR